MPCLFSAGLLDVLRGRSERRAGLRKIACQRWRRLSRRTRCDDSRGGFAQVGGDDAAHLPVCLTALPGNGRTADPCCGARRIGQGLAVLFAHIDLDIHGQTDPQRVLGKLAHHDLP